MAYLRTLLHLQLELLKTKIILQMLRFVLVPNINKTNSRDQYAFSDSLIICLAAFVNLYSCLISILNHEGTYYILFIQPP